VKCFSSDTTVLFFSKNAGELRFIWLRRKRDKKRVGEDGGGLGEDRSGDGEVEQMAPVRRKSKGGGGEEEPRVTRGRTKGTGGGGQHWAEGRKVPCIVGAS
jgi:hypothetical protein